MEGLGLQEQASGVGSKSSQDVTQLASEEAGDTQRQATGVGCVGIFQKSPLRGSQNRTEESLRVLPTHPTPINGEDAQEPTSEATRGTTAGQNQPYTTGEEREVFYL